MNSQQKNYVETGGQQCFACYSTEIEGGSITVEPGKAIQLMHCNECHYEWTDIYTLSHVVAD